MANTPICENTEKEPNERITFPSSGAKNLITEEERYKLVYYALSFGEGEAPPKSVIFLLKSIQVFGCSLPHFFI